MAISIRTDTPDTTAFRRKFDEAVKSLPKGKAKGSSASQGLAYCNLLFKIEQGLSEKTAEERHNERLKQSKPV